MPIFKSRRPMKKKPMGAGGKSGGPGGPGGPGGAKFKNGKKKKHPPKRIVKKKRIVKPEPASIESTGMESLYLSDLIESETTVVVVLNNGEEVRGRIRYYDQDVFSIGPEEGGPKLFLRKSGIRYMYEAE